MRTTIPQRFAPVRNVRNLLVVFLLFLSMTLLAAPASARLKAPTHLHKIAASTTSVTLSWHGVRHARGYKIYRKVGKHWQRVITLRKRRVRRWRITGLHPDSLYRYAVRAFSDHAARRVGRRSATLRAHTKDVIDDRVHAHGINIITNPVTGVPSLIWSDAYASGQLANGSWTHDIFTQPLDLSAPTLTRPLRLISHYEAQEPASASVTADGSTIVTFEDGNDTHGHGVAQRFALFRADGTPVTTYATLALGGHSGHAASTANRHVIFWNDEWVDGGGVDDLGTGDDVYVSTVTTAGVVSATIPVSVGSERDWWPLLAASPSRVLLVWQRYSPGRTDARLCYALYDPVHARLLPLPSGATRALFTDARITYYTFSVTYLANLDRFAVALQRSNGSSDVVLLDENGRITARATGLPGLAREASPACETDGDETVLVYPRRSSGVWYLRAAHDTLTSLGSVAGTYRWTICGTSGFVARTGRPYFATLGTDKLHLLSFPAHP